MPMIKHTNPMIFMNPGVKRIIAIPTNINAVPFGMTITSLRVGDVYEEFV